MTITLASIEMVLCILLNEEDMKDLFLLRRWDSNETLTDHILLFDFAFWVSDITSLFGTTKIFMGGMVQGWRVVATKPVTTHSTTTLVYSQYAKKYLRISSKK